MGIEYINKVVKISIGFTILGFLFITQAVGLHFGIGFFVGALWNTVNLWMLMTLVRNLFTQEPDRRKIFLLFLLKFPVLYGGGFVLVFYGAVHVVGVLVGFSLPLVLAVLKAAGKTVFSKTKKTNLNFRPQ